MENPANSGVYYQTRPGVSAMMSRQVMLYNKEPQSLQGLKGQVGFYHLLNVGLPQCTLLFLSGPRLMGIAHQFRHCQCP